MPLWEWLVREGISAYQANEKFRGPDVFEAGPGWCFDRFGCSRTELADGRVIHIAGEHEDSYDPDFYIYNDVIVQHPDGVIDIYGYPAEVFTPTDFHSATQTGDAIWIVGNLGYPEDRRVGTTPVHLLDLADFSIRAVRTTGACPGWIRKHRACVRDGSTLVIERGEVEVGENRTLDNVDVFALDLQTQTWTRRTQNPFQQWEIRRPDDEDLMLFDMSSAAFEEDHPEMLERRGEVAGIAELEELGVEMDSRKRLDEAGRNFDRSVYEQLYVPSIEHERWEATATDDEDDDDTYTDEARVRVGGALVRFARAPFGPAVQVKIEGQLDDGVVRALVDEFCAKLSVLQNAPCAPVLQHRQ